MALKVIVHRKRPAPSRGKAGKKQRRRHYYKMSSEEYYYEFRFDDDMVKVNYEFDFDSIDRYEMLEEFGPSDDPAVTEAQDQSMGETVAVKRVRPCEGDNGVASLCAVVREARCLDTCRVHPSILQLRGRMATDDKTDDLFIVIEQLQGSSGGGASTLRSRLTQPFSEASPNRDMGKLHMALLSSPNSSSNSTMQKEDSPSH